MQVQCRICLGRCIFSPLIFNSISGFSAGVQAILRCFLLGGKTRKIACKRKVAQIALASGEYLSIRHVCIRIVVMIRSHNPLWRKHNGQSIVGLVDTLR